MAFFAWWNRSLPRLTVLLALAIPSIGLAQNWIDEGSITSRRYQNQIREGNQIAATEFFTLVYSVRTALVEGRRQGPHMICFNFCNGDKHNDHADCDDTCDDSCTEEHTVTRKGEYIPDRAAMQAATRAANALAVEGGGSHSPADWSSRVSRSLANLRREARKKMTWEMPHAEACGGRLWQVGTQQFSFIVNGTMRKVGFTMRRGVRTPIDEIVGTHQQTVARAWLVQEDPHKTKEWEWCMCELLPPENAASALGLEDEIGGFFGGVEELFESTVIGGSGILMIAEDGEVVDPGESEITVKPDDLNSCVVEIENGTGRDVTVVIPIGTIFDADDPAVQDMSSMVRTSGMLRAGETLTLYVSVNPVPVQTTVGFPVRWACLNLAKKAPRPGDRFTIRRPQNDVLQRLGLITNRSRLRGPHDQARIWIYTDKATYDEVNRRLSPGVSRGRYSTILWEVATQGGVDLTSRDYQQCLEPRLLLGIPIYDEATAWLVGALVETKPRDLVRYVESNAGELSGLMKASPEYGSGHLATMVLAMANSDNEQVERAAVRFLQRVPEEHRGALAEAGGLRGLARRLASSNRRVAEEAVELLMDYPAEYADDLLGAMWEQLPTDALKEKVRNHLGIEVSDGA